MRPMIFNQDAPCRAKWVRRVGGLLAAGMLLAAASVSAAQSPAAALLQDARVQQALEQIKAEDERALREQIEIAQIEAPPFKEEVRAKEYLQRLQALGLKDAQIDSEGNVIAVRKGRGNGPTLVLSAHLDTVFPAGTDVTVQERDGRYYGPGIGDDARGLAALLSILRALDQHGIETSGDLMFVGTVGEEGLGDLRGVKALLRERTEIDGFISIDGSDPLADPRRSQVVVQATGSRRWRVTFKTNGGHSYSNFGSASAIHAMGRAIAGIAELRTPADPKTTFTVGTVEGGTSVNAIAGEAQMLVDMRSTDTDALMTLEKQLMAVIDKAVADENARWNSSDARVEKELLGDRPAGRAEMSSPVIQAVLQVAEAMQLPRPELRAASTDANVPLSLGLPAATLPGGGVGDKAHSLQEWYEPREAWLGPQKALLTALVLVGVPQVSQPLLPER